MPLHLTEIYRLSDGNQEKTIKLEKCIKLIHVHQYSNPLNSVTQTHKAYTLDNGTQLIQTSMTRKTLLDVSCKRFTDEDHYCIK